MTASPLRLPEFPPKAEFRKWLRSMPPDEVVAKQWNCSSCPLALWLFDSGTAAAPHIRPDPVLGDSAWRPRAPQYTPTQPLPAWANEFGLAIDRLAKPYRATAADCLAVLRRTPRG